MSHLFVLSILLFVLFVPARIQALEVTEIAYDRPGSDDKREWIELHNETDQTASLIDMLFFDGSYHGLATPPEKGSRGMMSLAPGEYLILADDAIQFLTDYPDYNGTVIDTSMNLPNYKAGQSPINLRITTKDKQDILIIDYLPTEGGKEGRSLELHHDGSWRDSIVNGTPGQPPSSRVENYSASVRFSEVVANPEGADANREWIELYNSSDQMVDITDWYIIDKSTASGKTNKYTFATGTIIQPGSYYLVMLKGSMLNNTDEQVSLLWPNDQLADSVAVSGSADEGTSYAYFSIGWQVTTELTPGEINRQSVSMAGSGLRSPLAEKQQATVGGMVKPSSSGSQRTANPIVSSVAIPHPSARFQQAIGQTDEIESSPTVAGSATSSNLLSGSPALHLLPNLPVTTLTMTRLWPWLLVVLLVGGGMGYWYRQKIMLFVKRIKERWWPTLIV